nr:hypothetical protein [uncultured Methanoregula sp.]
MCGIFGIIIKDQSDKSIIHLRNQIIKLFKFSESRGKEGTGITIRTSKNIFLYKQQLAANQVIKSNEFSNFLDIAINKNLNENHIGPNPIIIIGHTRMVTNGEKAFNYNNQPVVKNNIVGVHNGIIVNDFQLWNDFPDLKREYEVDTEIFLTLFEKFLEQDKSMIFAARKTFPLIEGAASVALIFKKYFQVFLGSNTGSLYYTINQKKEGLIFASERFILEESLKGNLQDEFDIIKKVIPNEGLIIDLPQLGIQNFSISAKESANIDKIEPFHICDIIDLSPKQDLPSKIMNSGNVHNNSGSINRVRRMLETKIEIGKKIKRCSNCLLPETFPFISFDSQGVCNYCRDYKKIEYLGHNELKKFVSPFKRDDGEPDCIVPFSGGRDSSYMLHYIKMELGMNPIAFTYDWGMITDLGRRNQARVCGKLGVEQILISADIAKKRENIKKNIEAWLKKPDLGMVPLLMAGDKQFMYYPHILKDRMKIPLVFTGASPYEKTEFKLGFCGIREGNTRGKDLLSSISLNKKINLASYYGKEFLLNPSYINSSIFDTMHAFYSSYCLSDINTKFYSYIPWIENEIINVLKKEYNWEIARDTNTTWRIGDGTAAFYNYIYYTIAGFSEFDTFRSNQIREGLITREQGLKMVIEENNPRFESLEWYAQTIGFNLEEAIQVIQSAPKLYSIP